MNFPDSRSASAQLYQRALASMPGGNTRTSLWWPPYVLYAESGSGAEVTDVDGDTRVDFHNAFSALIHGHSHPLIVERLREQAGRLLSVGMSTRYEIDLAETICARLPGANRIRFTNSGTEATMTALKAARGYNGRPRFAKCEGCYHGSYETLELSTSSRPSNWGEAEHPNAVPQSKGTPQATVDEAVILPFNDVEASRRLIERHASELAAVFIDPVPVRMGLITASDDYLKMLREVTAAAGIVLVFDEVVTFRMAPGGYQGIAGIEPDLTTLGKFIGGGLPVGAIAGKRDFMAVFDPGGSGPDVWHGGTFNANPMTMVAGLASMELLDDEVYPRMDALAASARSALAALFGKYGLDWQLSGYGSMFRFHAHGRDIRNYRTYYPRPEESQTIVALMTHLLNAGIVPTRIGVLSVSSVMDERHVDALTRAVDDSLRQMDANGELAAAQAAAAGTA